jgi:hypothetical protein
VDVPEIRNRPEVDSLKACVGIIFWTGLETSLADAVGCAPITLTKGKGGLKDLLASSEIPAKPIGLCRMEPSGTMEDPQDSRRFQRVSDLQFGIVSDSAPIAVGWTQ